MKRFVPFALLLVLSSRLTAQRTADYEADTPRSVVAGIGLQYGSPQGEFASNVNGVFGLGVYGGARLGSSPFVIRGDLGWGIYGSETWRGALGTGPLSLISVDVNTTNNILMGDIGLQVGHPGRSINPYVGGAVGFSYFFTQSSVSGSHMSSNESFASSTNLDDGTFAKTLYGGFYIPVGSKGASLDVGVRYHWNGEALYLTQHDISFDNANNLRLSPHRTRADLLTFHVGMAFGRR